MTAPAVGLTVVSGGINRLRTKGGASKDSLFDLLNGYVTQANTVKVRPGTIRNAQLDGSTKGLVAYQGELHVFGAQVVTVPDGYQLHVLGHPSGRTNAITNNTSNITLTLGQFPSHPSPAQIGGNTQAGQVDGLKGMVKAAIYSGGTNVGSASPATWDGTNALDGVVYTNASSIDDPHFLYVIVETGYAIPALGADTVTYPVQGGGTATLTLDASAQSAGDVIETGKVAFGWDVSGALPAFTGSTAVITRGFKTQAYDIIPIKEIHFAAPYLGGLYVVAEFTSDGGSGLGTVFHYWIQSSTSGSTDNEWTALTDHLIGDVIIPTTPNGLTYIASRLNAPNPIWTANTQVAVDTIVEPTTYNGFQFEATTVLGANPTTGSTEPVWPTEDGATVTEQSALANDQTVTIATAAPITPAPSVPPRYRGI